MKAEPDSSSCRPLRQGAFVVWALIVLGLNTLITVGITQWLESYYRVKQQRWETKRRACLEALDVIDSYFANRLAEGCISGFEDTVFKHTHVPPMDIATVRRVMKELSISCEDNEVLEVFSRALGLDGSERATISLDIIVDLRNAIRGDWVLERK